MAIEFDLLYNNITSNSAPGLDNYEKSRMLTIAQESIVREYYNGTTPLSNSFEKNEAMRRSLAELVSPYHTDVGSSLFSVPAIEHIQNSTDFKYPSILERPALGSSLSTKEFKDYIVRIPNDVLFVIMEYVTYKDEELKCFNDREVAVIPVTHDELLRVINNPFKGPTLRRVLRLDIGRTDTSNTPGDIHFPSGNTCKVNVQAIELISKYDIDSYDMRYLKKPRPIIIEDCSGDVPINGETNAMDCQLSELIHRDIVERAVQIASAVYKGSATNNK